MILLLESHPHARLLLKDELARHWPVHAPDFSEISALGNLISEVLREGRCRLLVVGDELPGTRPASLIRLLRAYLPGLPVVAMVRRGETLAPIARVITVAYQEFTAELGPTVELLLEVESEERSAKGIRRSPTLTHSPALSRLGA